MHSVMSGYIDSFRISNIQRYTSFPFSVPASEDSGANGTSNDSISLYIGSRLSLNGVGFKIKTSNIIANNLTIASWNGTGWENSSTTIVDGTKNSSKSLCDSGEILFTCNNAVPTLLKGSMSYWYRFNWDDMWNEASIYHMYGKAPIQQITDLWDGEIREIQGCMKWDDTAGHFKDKLSHAVKKDGTVHPWVNATGNLKQTLTPGTYASVSNFTASDYYLIGASERAMGISVKFPPDATGEGSNKAESEKFYTGNTEQSISYLSYWTGSSFLETSNYLDGTKGCNKADANNTCTFNHDGMLTWSPPDERYESRTSINQSPELYWYKYTVDNETDKNCAVDQFMYVPAPQTMRTHYKFPVFWLNSICLSGKNELLIGYPGALNVFNGNGSNLIEIGDASPLVAGGALPLVHSTGMSETLILTKTDETWALTKMDDDKVKVTKISDTHGCASPYTFAICDLGTTENNTSRAVAIWQSSDSIVMYMDGNILDVSKDIKNYFKDMHDSNKTTRVNPAMMSNSSGFFDPLFNEYHWMFANDNNTTLDKELVFDIPKQKWYEMVRGTSNTLTCGTSVADNNGSRYIFAGCNDGNVKRLEYGLKFDTRGITCTLQTGFYADGNNTNIISKIRHAKILYKPIVNVGNATLYHLSDGSTDLTTVSSFSVNGNNYYDSIKKSDQYNAEFHGWKLEVLINSSENSTQVDFEPLAITYMYKNVREDI